MESLIFLYRSAAAPRHASHVLFHDVRVKTFSAHVTTKIAPVVRETWLFTHGRATPSFTTPPPVSQCHVYSGRRTPRSAAPSGSIL